MNMSIKMLGWSLVATALTVSACKKETIEPEPMAPTGSFKATSQTISQNTVVIEEVTLSADGWVVIHADNGNNGPVVPEIISEPVFVPAGTTMNVEVPFTANATLTDGDQIWVMLHTDTGIMGTYEFDGNSAEDGPIVVNGNMAIAAINIMSPKLMVQDQPVVNNTITIPEVVAAADGWLTVHNDDGTGNIVLPGIIGKTLVKKGVNTNVVVQLDANNTYTAGQKLFPMLHLDNGQIGVYEFDGASQFDGPEIFGNNTFPGNVIFTSFTVQ